MRRKKYNNLILIFLTLSWLSLPEKIILFIYEIILNKSLFDFIKYFLEKMKSFTILFN